MRGEGGRSEMFIFIARECSNQAQKEYKTRFGG